MRRSTGYNKTQNSLKGSKMKKVKKKCKVLNLKNNMFTTKIDERITERVNIEIRGQSATFTQVVQVLGVVQVVLVLGVVQVEKVVQVL